MNIKKAFLDLKERASLEYEILKMNTRIGNLTPAMMIAAVAATGVGAMNIAATTPGDKPKTEQTINKTTLDGKTVMGYVVDENNNPWSNQLASILLGDSTVASDTIRNGYFTLENILVGVKNEGGINPSKFTLEQNYPNPFNPHTTINYTLQEQSLVNLKVWDMQGREVKTLLNNEASAGTHSVIWDATNNDGEAVASGVYFYTLTTKQTTTAKKMVYVKGLMTTSNASQTSKQTSSGKANKNNNDQAASAYYELKISGPDVMTKKQEVNLSGPSPINTGTTTAPRKPVLKSTANGVYNLETKYDSLNNRLTPTGIANLKVSLGSNPSIFTYTDANGQFSFKVDKTGIDSLFITGATPSDTTYYNYHNPKITINLGTNNITAFNDTTGIPMITRMYDDAVGVDFLDYFFHVTRINYKFPGDHVWEKTLTRVRDEDLPIKTFMNRAIAPNTWYADSTWNGLKATETGRYKFAEVSTSDSALLIMRYDYENIGQGANPGVHYIPSGPEAPYLYHYEIRIRGPPGGSTLQAKYVPMVVAHEDLHLAFAFGEHSPYIQDLFYADALSRWWAGQPLKMSAREEKAVKTIYALERNPKLLHYKK
ncbi:MAG: T9SS type A sorting domain-containing protein [Nanoarchaeota archaeon]|nr:T9SS type A sorting domain-containing protein [Nanoarchaeota archaeon]